MTMKRAGMAGLILAFCGVLLAAQGVEKKETESDSAARQRVAMEAEKAEIKRQWDNLKSFQMELDQRAAAMEAFKKDLDEREKLLTQRFENESVNKQVIESYENIDPEQAAPLLMALFKEDETLTALLLRRMAAKKAGKILEAMIPLDPELSTRLSQKILTFYSDRKNQAPKPR
jgi:hypothetical protein